MQVLLDHVVRIKLVVNVDVVIDVTYIEVKVVSPLYDVSISDAQIVQGIVAFEVTPMVKLIENVLISMDVVQVMVLGLQNTINVYLAVVVQHALAVLLDSC